MTATNIRYPLATSTWGEEEREALQRVIASGRFTMGPEVKAFEQAFAKVVGSRHAVMLNSGSSANLVALGALVHSQANRYGAGDEVIAPAVGWSTTYAPIHQHGLCTVLVDVDASTFNIDIDAARRAITERTRAIISPNVLGNPAPLDVLADLCADHDLDLIEDNCEGLGATLAGRDAGTFGRAGTFSFYFSHHISTMEGGMVVTDDDEVHQLLLALRAHGWTRDLPRENLVAPPPEDEFMAPFWFAVPGYNVRPHELSGAVGRTQLEKLPAMLAARRTNATTFDEMLERHQTLTLQTEHGNSSWFGFGITTAGAPVSRNHIAEQLLGAGIETRPIISGNIARQPMMKRMTHRIAGQLQNADRIHDHGLFVGNHSRPLDTEVAHLDATLRTLLA